MPLLYIVNIPKNREPVFPDVCIVCQRNTPQVKVRLASHSLGWWLLFTLKFGAMADVRVPACVECSKLLDRDRMARWLATAGIAIVGIFLLVRLLGGNPTPRQIALGMGLGLLCLTPLIVWEWKTPLPIELTSYLDSVDYIFRNDDYAQQFARLNGVETLDPWVRRRAPSS